MGNAWPADRRIGWTKLVVAAIASAVLYVLSMPPRDGGSLAFVALVPLLVALAGATRRAERLVAGALFGAISVVGVASWVPAALVRGNEMSPASATVVAGAVLAWHAGWLALFPSLAHVLAASRLPRVLAAALAWLALETLRDALVPALAWTVYGHSQHDMATTRALAAWVGGSGLSLLLVLVNGLVADALTALRPRPRRALVLVVATAALVAVWLGAGHARVRALDAAAEAGVSHSLRVGAVQIAVPQAERWQPERAWPRVEALLALTRDAHALGAQLVVWPETAVETHLDELAALGPAVAGALGGDPRTHVLLGAPRRVDSAEGERFFNSAVLLAGDGARLALYDKRELYPISETAPGWLARVPVARRLFAPQLRWAPYSAGSSSAPLDLAGVPVGVLICAEAIRPGAARERVTRGATLLVQLANDAVLPAPAAAAQHFAIVRLRAVETGRPLVRASNLGRTAVVDANGRVLAESDPERAGRAVATITPRGETTPFVRGGFALPWLGVAATAVAAFAGWRRGRRDERRG